MIVAHWKVDTTGRVTESEVPEKIVGHYINGFDDCWNYVHPAERARGRALFMSAIIARQRFRGFFRVLCKDGMYHNVEVIAEPRYVGGAFAGYVGSLEVEEGKLFADRHRVVGGLFAEGRE